VLHTNAHRDIDDYGSFTTRITTYPGGLKAFKAGVWLDLLGECYDELTRASKKRDQEKNDAKIAEQASKIDLGDY
jgi:hypothetical protein